MTEAEPSRPDNVHALKQFDSLESLRGAVFSKDAEAHDRAAHELVLHMDEDGEAVITLAEYFLAPEEPDHRAMVVAEQIPEMMEREPRRSARLIEALAKRPFSSIPDDRVTHLEEELVKRVDSMMGSHAVGIQKRYAIMMRNCENAGGAIKIQHWSNYEIDWAQGPDEPWRNGHKLPDIGD